MSYTDWIPILDKIEDKKSLSILEFGIGVGTKALVDNFKRVFSLEINNQSDWFNKISNELQNSPNWSGQYIDSQEVIKKHLELAATNVRDSKALLALLEETKEFIDYSSFDVFFVDTGFYFRGEVVNFLVQFSPKIIMVHDTNGMGMYGYNLVPDDQYLLSTFDTGDGTGLFKRK